MLEVALVFTAQQTLMGLSTVAKNPPANVGDARDMGLIPRSGRSPGGGYGNSPQCSCLENLMDRGSWWATVRGIEKSDMTEQLTHTNTRESRTLL